MFGCSSVFHFFEIPFTSLLREDPSPAPLSATDRMKCHVSMTLELKDAPPKKSIPCKMPRCGALVRNFF